MYPASTSYYLACTPAEYRALHAFMRAESIHPLAQVDRIPDYAYRKVQFPCVYAKRDNAVVGIMCSRISPRLGLVASPTHVTYSIPNHVPVLLRLIDCYDILMQRLGIQEYKVIMPAWKPSGRRIWEELHAATLYTTYAPSPDRPYNVYRVPVQIG